MTSPSESVTAEGSVSRIVILDHPGLLTLKISRADIVDINRTLGLRASLVVLDENGHVRSVDTRDIVPVDATAVEVEL